MALIEPIESPWFFRQKLGPNPMVRGWDDPRLAPHREQMGLLPPDALALRSQPQPFIQTPQEWSPETAAAYFSPRSYPANTPRASSMVTPPVDIMGTYPEEEIGAPAPQSGAGGGLFGRMRSGLSNNWLPIMQAGLGMMAGGGWGRMPRDFLQIAGEAGGPALQTKMHLDQQAFRNRILEGEEESRRVARDAFAKRADTEARKFTWEEQDRARMLDAVKNLPEPWKSMAEVDPKAAVSGWAATLKPSGAGTQYERSFSRLRELQMKADAGAELTPQEWLEAATARALLSQERSFVDPASGQVYTYKPITIPPDIAVGLGKMGQQGAQPAASTTPQDGGQFNVAQLPGSAVPNVGGRKPVDADTEKELRGYGDASVQLTGLATSFSPNYGGWKLDSVAEAALLAGRRLPESLVGKDLVDQAQWWQRYYNWANDMRAAKFGLTLTGNELQAFERATPKPSDSPETIARSLKTQQELLQRKINSRVEALRAGGYNMGQTEALAYPRNSDDNVVRFRRNPKTGVLEIEK